MIRAFKAALSLLTILPIRWDTDSPLPFRNAATWFPAVGLLIGLPVAGVLLLPWPPLPRAALALLVSIVCSGALHEDGVMDSADAAFAPVPQERRAAVRKDPRVGAFAVTAAGVLLLARFAALSAVPARAAVFAALTSRWCMSCTLALRTRTAHSSMAAEFTRAGLPIGASSMALVLILAGLLLLRDARVVSASASGLMAGVLSALFLARRLGELSGDVHGAAGVIAETVTLYAFLPVLR